MLKIKVRLPLVYGRLHGAWQSRIPSFLKSRYWRDQKKAGKSGKSGKRHPFYKEFISGWYLYNDIRESCAIPDNFKSGTITTVPNKGIDDKVFW
jgi:hypothetical protein